MHYPHAKLVLYKVSQDKLVEYLYLLGCRSYVSPTVNYFTVMYDLGFETHIGSYEEVPKDARYIFDYSVKWLDPSQREHYKSNIESSFFSAALRQENLFDLTMLNPTTSSILTQYKGLPEGSLTCWASHLSNHFSCVALAFYLRNDSDFWYHLSQNGEMLDEYTTYAEAGWQPGQPIFSKTGEALAGGDSDILCSALGQPDKVDEVEIILRKPRTVGESYPISNLDYESLLNSNGFSVEQVRHWALAKALGMHPLWAIWMNYAAIASKEERGHFGDYQPPAASWAEIMTQLKSSQPISELKRAARGIKKPKNPSIDYAKKRIKRKGIEIFHPNNIVNDFREAVQMLAESSTPGSSDISALLSEFVEVNLTSSLRRKFRYLF
jgi:hypothetical protein